MAQPIIQMQGVGKRYRRGEIDRTFTSLREVFSSGAQRLFRRRPPSADASFWALRDLDLEVEEGSSFGIVGRNGAGKTTLLRLLARITEPTIGVSRTRGRIGSFLDVGTGFHPELTGRENVFLNGAILGFSRATIRSRFDEIVAFAEVEGFIDTPLKRFSSGMALRLAFSVAAHLEPEILVIDEVLTVGDREFQARALGRLREVIAGGRTVLFVSHDLDALRRTCDQTLWIDRGRARLCGATNEVLDAYLQDTGPVRSRDDAAQGILRAMRADCALQYSSDGLTVQGVEVRVRFELMEAVEGLTCCLLVTTREGVRIADEAWSGAGASEHLAAGTHQLRIVLPPVLTGGPHQVGMWFGLAGRDLFLDEDLCRMELPEERRSDSPRLVRLNAIWERES